MTANKRIFLNIVATYGRSLYALVIGLFTARWVFQTLGVEDYGLLGVVGGMMGFVAFFNSLMASAVGRFYAFAVGESQKVGFEAQGLENCRHWFNVALFVHTVLPTVLIVLGYPIGVWAIQNYLAIASEKIPACIWVWRFSCLSCYVSMVSVPFAAFYSAKQEIAELTIYGLVATTVNAIFLYYMMSHPGFWLVKYSAWCCFIGTLPQLLVSVMAWFRFAECRFRREYLWDVPRMKELVVYAGGRLACSLAQMFSRQGTVIAVNKLLGLASNAAMAVGNTVVMHTASLTGSCAGALYPAITNAAGRGDLAQMRALSYRMCKFATLAMMMFAWPLIPELDTVLKIWLKTPPAGAAGLCAVILIANVVDHLTDGHWMAIFAMGKVTKFNICEAVGFFLAFAIAVILMFLGCGVLSAGFGALIAYLYAAVVKLVLSRTLCGFSVRYWIRRIFIPLATIGVIGLATGYLPRLFMPDASFFRLVASVAMTMPTVAVLSWFVGLDVDERAFVREKFCLALKKFHA